MLVAKIGWKWHNDDDDNGNDDYDDDDDYYHYHHYHYYYSFKLICMWNIQNYPNMKRNVCFIYYVNLYLICTRFTHM